MIYYQILTLLIRQMSLTEQRMITLLFCLFDNSLFRKLSSLTITHGTLCLKKKSYYCAYVDKITKIIREWTISYWYSHYLKEHNLGFNMQRFTTFVQCFVVFNIINTTNVANGTANDNTSGASEFSAELRHLHFLCIVFYGQLFFFSSISFCHFYCLSLFDFRLL
jgi:hypothetical protein